MLNRDFSAWGPIVAVLLQLWPLVVMWVVSKLYRWFNRAFELSFRGKLVFALLVVAPALYMYLNLGS